ncbi:MAG: two-component regulator propeller domain-containing protein [Acidobacteriota bacterium]
MFARVLRLLGALIIMLPPSPLTGLDPHKAITQYGLDVWTRKDGLPQNSITSIIQTRDGYLWFGTEEGLARFDGVRFTLFNSRNTPALAEQTVCTLLEDQSGTLWIGTLSHLVSYRDDKWTSYTLPKEYAGRLSYCLYQTTSGEFWVGNRKKVGTFHGGTIEDSRDAKGNTINGAMAICETSDGSAWFASRGLYSLKGGAYSPICVTPSGILLSCMVTSPGGAIWFGTYGAGLGHLEKGRCSYLTTRDGLASDLVSTLLFDRNGNLWIGTVDGGLQRLSGGSLSTLTDTNGLSSSQIYCLYEDREGSLWVGTNGGGLNRLRDGRCTTYSTTEGLKGSFVQAVSEGTDGSVWIGTNDGGLSRLKDGKFIANYSTKDSLSNESVTCLLNDRYGVLWIGTGGGGLHQLIDGKIRPFPRERGYPGPLLFTIYEDHAGGLWIGTDAGLWQMRDQRLNRVSGFGESPICMEEDSQGTLWIGTNHGGLKGLANGQLISFTTKEGLSNDIVVCIHEDETGALWIGTAGGGLNRLQCNKLTRITTRDGLFSDSVYQIMQDARGNLWMGCNNGIFYASLKELNQFAEGLVKSVKCVSFDESDGMRNRECNGGGQNYALKARDGSLWFATVDGVVRIDPEQVATNTLPPPVHLEQLVVNGRVVGGGGSGFPAVLPPGSNRLEFRYTGLSFLKPLKVQFRYKLDGLDADWIAAGSRREAFYTNVPPGKYTFRVIATNSDGVRNDRGAWLDFRIRPHFYQTPWFYALLTLPVIGAVFAVHRYRLQRVLELERVRMRIAADLHDEVGAGLTRIVIVGEMLQRQLGLSHDKASELASNVADISRGLIDSLTDVVWFIDPKMDDVQSLITRIRRFSSDILEARGIKWELSVPEDLPRIRVGSDHRRQILLIVKEAVNNIVRYASCSTVLVGLELSDGRIVGEIHDDGQGFDCRMVKPRGGGRGLAGMKARAERLGGTLSVSSEPGNGTRVSFAIPLTTHRHALARRVTSPRT